MGRFTHNKILPTNISAIITSANKQGQKKTETKKVYSNTKKTVTSQLLTVSNGDSDGLDGQFPTKQIYTLLTKDCSRFGCYPQ